MNHERMFNNLSNQLLEHLSHTEDELGFRLDKNMMHIPGARKPLVYNGLTVELAKDSDGPDNRFDWFEMSGTLPREQGPSSNFVTHRESGLDRPSNLIDVSGFSGVSGSRISKAESLGRHPDEGGVWNTVGYDPNDEMRSMAEVQRRMVDDPDLANWQDLRTDQQEAAKLSAVEWAKPEHSKAQAFMTPSDSFTGTKAPFWYGSDFDPASRQFDNPKIMKSWEDPGTPL